MTFVPKQRASLHFSTMGGPHLNVILYIAGKPARCMFAPISTIKPNRFFDPACVLFKGEHEWLKEERSYVVYRKMMEARSAHVINMVESKVYEVKDDVTEDLFGRIVGGLFDSENARPSIVREAMKAGLSAWRQRVSSVFVAP